MRSNCKHLLVSPFSCEDSEGIILWAVIARSKLQGSTADQQQVALQEDERKNKRRPQRRNNFSAESAFRIPTGFGIATNLSVCVRTTTRSPGEMDLFVRRSSVVTKKAAVCSDQPQATQIGLEILKLGGNAADAAIATMAAVSVMEPLACGIGGDCHCTFYSHRDRTVLSINGSGRTGKLSTLDKIRAAGITDPMSRDCFNHGLWVSVPGTVAGMAKVVEKFGSGKLSLKQILEPAVRLAEEGVPVPYKHALMWDTYQDNFRHSKNAHDLLIDGRVPAPGDILYAPKLAKVFRDIGDAGIESFYSGTRAQNIASAVQENGGALTVEDLKDHLENPPNPFPGEALSVDFRGFRIWEMKPNTMGIVALVAFNTLKAYDLKVLGHNSPEYIHLVSEATKHAYLESWEFLCDPKCCSRSVQELLTDEFAQNIRNKMDPER
ncbi:glutathione hydrolase proenzyme [Caerostris darwini]|uniref:Glutathione hydrolase proenzyme n=2 Tax=Caerostris darwini TaxID=1538125 RepID=A0AAV4U006_9ARAC|nr:glutathione hydrolase proenzyme [Caerostris darwini]